MIGYDQLSVTNQNTQDMHSLGLILANTFSCERNLSLFCCIRPRRHIPEAKHLGAVDYIKVEITSGAELQYEWQDKLHKNNYL